MKRILIADHSEIANRMFCTGLSKCGFLVTAVANVRDLLHQCSIGHYDLLLMDLYLDKTNQLEQILYLKKLCPGLFILVMSDEPDVSSAVQAMKNGADDFIEKPCELNLLTGKIQELLNSEAGWKENVPGKKRMGAGTVKGQLNVLKRWWQRSGTTRQPY